MTSPRRNSVDLHTHTVRSDGVLTPVELYGAMRAWGTRVAAITDHDTLAGYRELRAAGLTGKSGGPRIVAGVEINSVTEENFFGTGLGRDGEEVHVLGFGVDSDDAEFDAVLARQRGARQARMDLIAERLRALGRPVDELLAATEVAEGAAVGRPHVARAMIAAGYVDSIEEAFDEWIGPGAPAFVPRLGLGPREAIESIRQADGLPVLAHSPAAPERAAVVDRLVDWGLCGLEVHYRGFDRETVSRLLAFAASRSLLVTGGSDYHGDLVTYAESQAALIVPDDVGDALLARLA